jgi:carboxypeptidase D
MEITLELSFDKWPPGDQLNSFWDNNRNAMLSYIAQVNLGVRGLAYDVTMNTPVNASIYVGKEGDGGSTDFPRMFVASASRTTGKYYRLLSPGLYKVVAKAVGYREVTRKVLIRDGVFATLDFAMCREENACSMVEQPAIVYSDGFVTAI